MEKLKPLFDDIWLKRPLEMPDPEEDKAKEKELAELQAKVTELETKEMIQRSINQAIFSKLNPRCGMISY